MNKDKYNTPEHVQQALSFALKNLFLVLSSLDEDGRSVQMRFTDEDCMSAIFIMNSILTNNAFHNRMIDEEEAEAIGKNIHIIIKGAYGFDKKTDSQKESRKAEK